MNQLNLSEQEEKKDFSDNSLSHRFAPIETRLVEQMRSPDVTREDFESLCQSE